MSNDTCPSSLVDPQDSAPDDASSNVSSNNNFADSGNGTSPQTFSDINCCTAEHPVSDSSVSTYNSSSTPYMRGGGSLGAAPSSLETAGKTVAAPNSADDAPNEPLTSDDGGNSVVEYDIPGADESDDIAGPQVSSTVTQVADAAEFFAEQKAQETKRQKTRALKQGSVFSIMQYREHPDSGQIMLTQEQIDEGLALLGERYTIERYAYAWHDSDRVLPQDYLDGGDMADDDDVRLQQVTSEGVASELKPVHCHAVIWFSGTRPSVRAVSECFKIPAARVQLPNENEKGTRGGRGAAERAFFDFARYLVHESKSSDAVQGIHQSTRCYIADKYQYGHGRVVANFDFTADLAEYDEKMAKQRRNSSRKGSGIDELIFAVQEEGLTLLQARRRDPLTYCRFNALLKAARAAYLADAPLPKRRLNFYICGPSSAGKSVLAKILAASLWSAWFEDLEEYDAIFETGRKDVPLDLYEGQPICIWDDYRSGSLVSALGGREGVWSAFDPAPTRSAVNRKYGSTLLRTEFNIITGVQPYREFIDGLAGEYTDRDGNLHAAEDKTQAYRRMPFIIEATMDSIEHYVNMGFANGSHALDSYEAIAQMNNQMRKLAEHLNSLDEQEKAIFRARMGKKMCSNTLSRVTEMRSTSTQSAETAAAGEALLESIVVRGPEELAARPLHERFGDKVMKIARELSSKDAEEAALDRAAKAELDGADSVASKYAKSDAVRSEMNRRSARAIAKQGNLRGALKDRRSSLVTQVARELMDLPGEAESPEEVQEVLKNVIARVQNEFGTRPDGALARFSVTGSVRNVIGLLERALNECSPVAESSAETLEIEAPGNSNSLPQGITP